MLTCKVGNTIINCFDGKYDKHTLKKWDEEKRLICPDCGKLYEYCHGQVVTPYFRHKEKSKECDEIYSESETEEHIKGKTILYNWLLGMQNKGEISNLRLEGYIPETRQRPDLYFEKDGNRFVIEFQCTPIATEYLERHKLYELAGINDIWILGVEKYNIHINEYNTKINMNKFIEKKCHFYLNTKNSLIYINSILIRNKLSHKLLFLKEGLSFDLNSFNIGTNLSLNDSIIKKFQEEDNEIFNNRKCTFIKSIPSDDIIKKVVRYIDKKYKKINEDYEVKLEKYAEYETYNYYWNYRKRTKQKVLHYTYRICLYHQEYKKGLEAFFEIPLTNKIYEIKDKLELIKYIENIFENCKINIYCSDCHKFFKFSLKEFEFYIKMKFKLPKRCKSCRKTKTDRRISI